MIKNGTLETDSESIYYLNMYNFCEVFGWSIEQYENSNPYDLAALSSIMAGKSEGFKKKQKL